MNDRYLYRAKRMDNGEWVIGNLLLDIEKAKTLETYRIYPVDYVDICRIVDTSTICQCTGLKDKNGKLIWENYIIKCKDIITVVRWNTKYASWVLTKKGWMYDHFFGESQGPEECEVIGNIFYDSELLEVGE